MFLSFSLSTWMCISITSLLYLLYRYATATFDYFKDMGIPGPKPLPLVGNLWRIWRQNLLEYDLNMVKKYGRIYGTFEGRLPNLFITDVELISKIFIKDFDKFINRRSLNIKSKIHRMTLTLLRGQNWKNVRSSVSPIFTTGKIKKMSVIINQCTETLKQSLDSVVQNGGKLDVKKHFGSFTMNVIAKCAFGMNIDGIESGDDEFTRNARVLFDASFNKTPVILIPFVFPWIMKFGAEKAFMTKEVRFFEQAASQMVSERKRNNQKVDDFITLGLESIKEFSQDGKPIWDDSEVEEIVIAQAMLFLLAGFDTTGTALSMACYCLAMNPLIQEKIYQEISEKLEHFDDINYDLVNEIPYVEQFANEVLRMYPPALRIERECQEDVRYGSLFIKKGTVVTVPVYALHYDEFYYPDPNKFDPERWTPENKSQRSPYSYASFGLGPRNCIGMRFALEELKIALCNVIQRYRFYPLPETPEKIEQVDGFILLIQTKNLMVGIETR